MDKCFCADESNQSEMINLDCSHSFHVSCLRKTILLTCPLCRAELKSKNPQINLILKEIMLNMYRHKKEEEQKQREEIKEQIFVALSEEKILREEVLPTIYVLKQMLDIPDRMLPSEVIIVPSEFDYMPRGYVSFAIAQEFIRQFNQESTEEDGEEDQGNAVRRVKIERSSYTHPSK